MKSFDEYSDTERFGLFAVVFSAVAAFWLGLSFRSAVLLCIAIFAVRAEWQKRTTATEGLQDGGADAGKAVQEESGRTPLNASEVKRPLSRASSTDQRTSPSRWTRFLNVIGKNICPDYSRVSTGPSLEENSGNKSHGSNHSSHSDAASNSSHNTASNSTMEPLSPAPKSPRTRDGEDATGRYLLDTPTKGCYSGQDMEAAGVPSDLAVSLAKFANVVGAEGTEPLCDPLTLLRFYNAREGNLDDASLMYNETREWRASFSIKNAMTMHGSGETYRDNGGRTDLGGAHWNWKRHTDTWEARASHDYGFWGRLAETDPVDGAPMAVWRLGAMDFAGIVREDMVEVMIQGFAAHLEDLFQASRSLSRQKGRLIRCRMVIDVSGLGLGILQHRAAVRRIMTLGKSYFPEVNASVTIVRAPFVFSQLFAIAKPLLTPVMQRKICIVGNNFKTALREHAGVDISAMPRFLGGQAPDDQVGRCMKVPDGLRNEMPNGVRLNILAMGNGMPNVRGDS